MRLSFTLVVTQSTVLPSATELLRGRRDYRDTFVMVMGRALPGAPRACAWGERRLGRSAC
jgi:hypothetical protein